MKGYFLPRSEDEVLELLRKHNGRARVMAGGTDILLDMQSGKTVTEFVIDISRIRTLMTMAEQDGNIFVGAAVTHNQLAESPLIRGQARALAEASEAVGSYQIRNCSTLGGNVVSAQPAADSAVALVALDATAELLDERGHTAVKVGEMYAGVGKSTVDSSRTLVTRFIFPRKTPGEGSGYIRLQQRKALALPMLNVAAFLAVSQGRIDRVRVVMAPVGPRPQRAAAVEEFLIGKEPSKDLFQEAGSLALENAAPRDSLVRGSKRYRCAVLPELVAQALSAAWADSRLL